MEPLGDARAGTAIPPHPDDHVVTFYEDDGFLVDSVVAFLGRRPAIVIATREHLASIEASLTRQVDATPGASRDAPFVALDARETLERLMVNGRVDAASFREVVGRILDDVDGGDVHIFGEMVSILWEDGDVAQAIELEDLWNELADSRPFTLLCGYSMGSFDRGEDTGSFRTVCDKHSSVIPSESYSRLAGSDERLRHVAMLQQTANAGENERLALRRERSELVDALEELRGSDRLRSEFVAMVVHDIRSPASIASGYLGLLKDNWAELDEDDVEQFLTTATENLDRIQRLVGDVLTMSRIDSGEFTLDLRPMDLGPIVASTVRQVRASTGRDIRFERPTTLRAALVDEDRQVQILTNLLTNAVKFSPDDSPIRVTIDSDDDGLVVSVRDEGVGISQEDQHELFRPFSRVGGSGSSGAGGTGLGLYIARALVERQGGTIRVDSVPGAGSTFAYTVRPATTAR